MTSPPQVGHGLADLPAAELAPAVLGAWDDFLALVAELDLGATTRLKGWRVHDVLVHLGAWSEHDAVADLVASAGASTGAHLDADRTNKRLLAAHRDASRGEVLDALTKARDRVADYLATQHDGQGRELGSSVLGPLPLGTVVNASCYELAVHALDLVPAERVGSRLLDQGLAALVDTTGALSARHGITIEVAATTPSGGWRFTSSQHGWTTDRVESEQLVPVGIEGPAALILEASAGRLNAVPLLVSRKLVVHRLPSLLRLAPLVEEVPGIPGGTALKGAIKHLAGAGRLLGRLPGLRR